MGAFESYGSCAFPEIHNNQRYTVFVDITTKVSQTINPNIGWGKFLHEKILMEKFFRKIFDHEKSLYHMVTRCTLSRVCEDPSRPRLTEVMKMTIVFLLYIIGKYNSDRDMLDQSSTSLDTITLSNSPRG